MMRGDFMFGLVAPKRQENVGGIMRATADHSEFDPVLSSQVKPWWKSRTIWANIGMGLVAVGTEFLSLVEFIPPEYQLLARMYVTALIAVGNIVLRTVTYQGIK